MESWHWWQWLHLVAAVLILISGGDVEGGEVTYDGRSLLIDGQRKLLFSGTIHYPRSPPEMWPSLITKAKEGGLDVIETYVFWNIHEPQPGKYYFGGNYDLVGFLKEIQAQGLYACLRIGPYIEAEWNYGGFPFWLRTIPGIVFREDNEPFKQNMQRFVTKIVELMKSEKLFAPQGGPIILSQIENEYQNVEGHFGDKGPPYVKWAANMAVGLQTGVPWIMCKQTDAPDPIINTCNSMRCGDLFTGPNSPKKPSMWTENWTSFYQAFGGKPYMRNAKDIAYNVALFIAKNGCFVNYYMYYGGTNYGRTSSSYIMTSYYDQAPLDEYGLLRQPKYGHLTELHNVIKSLAPTLLQGEQKVTSLGEQQQAYTFQDGGKGCVAFLQNSYMHHATVQFQNKPFDMFPMSISILKNCDTEVFNTAKVDTPENNRVTKAIQVFDSAERWQEFRDAIPSIEHTTLKSKTFLEHISTTKDVSDYLWYTLSFENNQPCSNPVLHLESAAHVAHAFVNDAYFGAAHGTSTAPSFTMDAPIVLKDGTNKLSILGAMVGLPASGPFLESRVAGLTEAGIQCNGQESYKFTDYEWGYQVGLAGEKSQIYNGEKSAGVAWSNKIATNESLAWYKTVFDAPTGDDPIALDLSSMGKGHAWVNGQSIGRYWVSVLDPRGIPSQTIYHVPRSFLKPSGNILVLFEEAGGNPLKVALNSVTVA